MGKLTDNIIAAKLIKMLVVPFEEMDAFKIGIIDGDGNKLRKPSTMEDERAYNLLTRLVINLKRIFLSRNTNRISLSDVRHAAFLLKEMDLSFEDYSDDDMYDELESIINTLEECGYVDTQYDFLIEDVTTTSAIAVKDNKMTKTPLKRKTPVEFSTIRNKLKGN